MLSILLMEMHIVHAPTLPLFFAATHRRGRQRLATVDARLRCLLQSSQLHAWRESPFATYLFASTLKRLLLLWPATLKNKSHTTYQHCESIWLTPLWFISITWRRRALWWLKHDETRVSCSKCTLTTPMFRTSLLIPRMLLGSFWSIS